jgi:hypothetical protein
LAVPPTLRIVGAPKQIIHQPPGGFWWPQEVEERELKKRGPVARIYIRRGARYNYLLMNTPVRAKADQ